VAYLLVAAVERGRERRVASGGARRGRRDNGLVAAAYSAAGDVDPRVGEHLLDVLAVEGIAAYLQPASDMHPVTRTSTVPARPTDRLYVDRNHLGTAREYLSRLRADETAASGTGENGGAKPDARSPASGPDGEPDDVEAEFARIVAGFHADFHADLEADLEADPQADPQADPEANPEVGTVPWPSVENVAETPAERRARRRTDLTRPELNRTDRPVDAYEPSLLDGLDTFGADLPDEDEGYTPPPAPPLPRLSRAAVVATLSMAFGLALFFSPGLLPISTDQALLLGFAALLTGFVILIWRLRPGDDDEDSDPDDGAVV
jgi:hypothetical protein